MKNIFWVGGAALLALALIWAARAANEAKPETFVGSVLETVSENDIDLGVVSMADGKVSRTFTLENSGGEPVEITRIWTSCMCTEAVLKTGTGEEKGRFGMHGKNRVGLKVSPGEKVLIEAVYDPNAHGPAGVGPIARSVYVETNSSVAPKLELKFRGTVVR